MKTRIWLSPPHLGGDEINYINSAFESNWIAPQGANVDLLEARLNSYLSSSTVALCSGTAALHLALVLLDIQPGDIVICQSLTFAGSAFPILYQNAMPVFIDSESETWNLCPGTLREAIIHFISKGKKPKAVIGVHLYGMPARLQKILEVCQEYEIPLIEDAAEALGGSYHGRQLGSFGTFSILSFNGNKIITTSGGGALVCRNQIHSTKAKSLAAQARDPASHYEHSQVGFNYQMSNIAAGIGCGQLEVLEKRVEKRRSNFSFYEAAFHDVPDVSFQKEEEGSLSNRWLTAIMIAPNAIEPEAIRVYLEKEQIETRRVWKPMHLQPVFKTAPYFGGTVSEQLFDTGLCLPSGSNLTDDDLNRIATAVRTALS
jgi:dTDP-4-amino-4,6-dideoxygalactose transaminase